MQPTVTSSLVGRVATGTAISASIVGLVAASMALLVADRFVASAEDKRLGSVATVVLTELNEPGRRRSLRDAITHEQSELDPAAIKIAAWQGAAFVGGDTQIPRLAPGTCAPRVVPHGTVRDCGATDAGLDVVISAPTAAQSVASRVAAAFAAAGIAAIAAGLLGLRAARWALGPLTRLRDSLTRIEIEDPTAFVLPSDEACSEVHALREALEHLLARLTEALGAARAFSADAAHELKTPLTVLRTELELLAEEPLDPASRDALPRLRAQVEALALLVDRLLALATTGAHSQSQMEAVAFEDVAHDLLRSLDDATRNRVELRTEAPGMVRGEEALLRTLLENAVSNALKFSTDSPVVITVAEEAAAVTIDVRDYGPGISAADRRRAFEPFFRSAAARARGTPGHGVGLALVARIAAAHAGSVAFVDLGAGEQGTQLRVVIPAWSPPKVGPTSPSTTTTA